MKYGIIVQNLYKMYNITMTNLTTYHTRFNTPPQMCPRQHLQQAFSANVSEASLKTASIAKNLMGKKTRRGKECLSHD